MGCCSYLHFYTIYIALSKPKTFIDYVDIKGFQVPLDSKQSNQVDKHNTPDMYKHHQEKTIQQRQYPSETSPNPASTGHLKCPPPLQSRSTAKPSCPPSPVQWAPYFPVPSQQPGKYRKPLPRRRSHRRTRCFRSGHVLVRLPNQFLNPDVLREERITDGDGVTIGYRLEEPLREYWVVGVDSGPKRFLLDSV